MMPPRKVSSARSTAKVESDNVSSNEVEEAPVEEAPVEEAPVEEAPVEEAPVEEAPPSKAYFVPSSNTRATHAPSGAVYTLRPGTTVKMMRTDAEFLAAANLGQIKGA